MNREYQLLHGVDDENKLKRGKALAQSWLSMYNAQLENIENITQLY